MTNRKGTRLPLGSMHVKHFVPGAKISGLVLVVTSSAVMSIYGVSPLLIVLPGIRDLILLVWYWNVGTFALCGGMLLWGWLVDRYGDSGGDE